MCELNVNQHGSCENLEPRQGRHDFAFHAHTHTHAHPFA